MQQKKITIINELGLHARASSKLVTLASKFNSHIELIRNHKTVNAKSIMGVMILAASKGTDLILTTDGEDEEQAMTEIEALIRQRFGEEN